MFIPWSGVHFCLDSKTNQKDHGGRRKYPTSAPAPQPGDYFLPAVGALKFFKLVRSPLAPRALGRCAPSAQTMKNFRALHLRSRPGGIFFEGRGVRFRILSVSPESYRGTGRPFSEGPWGRTRGARPDLGKRLIRINSFTLLRGPLIDPRRGDTVRSLDVDSSLSVSGVGSECRRTVLSPGGASICAVRRWEDRFAAGARARSRRTSVLFQPLRHGGRSRRHVTFDLTAQVTRGVQHGIKRRCPQEEP